MKRSLKFSILLWILSTLSDNVEAASKYSLCTSDLLDEGLTPSQKRIRTNGGCQQSYEMTIHEASSTRFCRQRFPLPVSVAKVSGDNVNCEWNLPGTYCESDETQIGGNCYKVFSPTTSSKASQECSSRGWSLAYVDNVLNAYWIAKLMAAEGYHFWVETPDSKSLFQKVSHPLTKLEMVVTKNSEYSSASNLLGTTSTIFATRKDLIVGVERAGSLLKADPDAEFPVLCMRGVKTSAGGSSSSTHSTKNLLPRELMSQNFHTFSPKDIVTRNGQKVVNVQALHTLCETLSDQVCGIPQKVSAGDKIPYWATAALERSVRKNYDNCQVSHDVKQEFLLYSLFPSMAAAVYGILLSAFAAGQPKPMCADFDRVAVEASSDGLSAIPPLARRPLYYGQGDYSTSIARDDCVCVSDPSTSTCDPKTKVCSCLQGYRPVKDDRYIAGYNCEIIPTTQNPCTKCKINSTCITANPLKCKCVHGHEENKKDPSYENVPNSVCKRKPCPCTANAVCADYETGQCKCKLGMVDVLQGNRRHLANPQQYKKKLHCHEPCRCPGKTQCEELTQKCKCYGPLLDAMDPKVPVHQRRGATDYGQVCLSVSCNQETLEMTISLLIDDSGSIKAPHWKNQIEFLKALGAELNSKAFTVQFVFFESGVSSQVLKRGTWDKANFDSVLDSYVRKNGLTNTVAGVYTAYKFIKSNPAKQSVIFLITDGYPYANGNAAKESGLSTCQHSGQDQQCLEALGTVIRQEGIKFYGVTVGSLKNSNFQRIVLPENLQSIADFNGLSSQTKDIVKNVMIDVCNYNT